MSSFGRRAWIVPVWALAVAACGEATKPPVQIAQGDFSMRSGHRVVSTGAVMVVATRDSTQGNPRLLMDTIPITGPGVYTIRAGDPGFAQATARLHDGHRDVIEVGVHLVPNGGGFTVLDWDWRALGRSESDGDLAAYRLTSVSLVIDSAVVSSPGSDPNGDGIWTDERVLGHLRVYGDSL